MPAEQCPQGHGIRSTADRDKQGYCRRCRADNARKRRMGKEAALIVVRALEKAGVQFQNDGVPADPADVVRQLADAYAAGLFDS